MPISYQQPESTFRDNQVDRVPLPDPVVKTKDPCIPAPKKSIEFYMDSVDHSVQSGFRSKKEQIKATYCESECDSVAKVDQSFPKVKQYMPTAEQINTAKHTFRSGFRQEVPGEQYKTLLASEQRILKGALRPHSIKPEKIYGNENSANGWNGWKRKELYAVGYKNIWGQGPDT